MQKERWVQIKQIVTSCLDLEHNERESCIRRLCGKDSELTSEVRSLLECHAEMGDFLNSSKADEHWQRLREIFQAASEIVPEARQAFLNAAGREDNELKRQLELLLANEEEAGNLVAPAMHQIALPTGAVDRSLIGRQIGAYRIVSPLGAGSMGEVYRAHDNKLKRDVAIKTLPVAFARDHEWLARLRREACTLASLNHPNIAVIYGLEESSDIHGLVLELVEGDILRGPVPIRLALDYAKQVAEALEAAHDKGIIHRDLKPGNIKVTPHGRVKVLDFGLAKAISGEQVDPRFLQPDTAIHTGTFSGQIAGTPGYMSPEQARGEKVDRRTDIWAFGCLLYELLTGSCAFPGETPSERVRAVLEREPAWEALPAKTPARIRELLRLCLQKQADRRLDSIAKVRIVLEETRLRRSRSQFVALAATLLVAVALGVAMWLHQPLVPPDRSQWVQLTEFPDPVSQPALSPDGRMLAFVRSPSTFFAIGQVYVKRLPDGEIVQLTHDDLAKTNPTFSPDGTHIAYTTVDSRFNWDTWVVPVGGGEPRTLLRNASDLVWAGPTELFSERPHKGIVAAEQGAVRRHDVYLPPNERGIAHRPEASPDGKFVLLTELDGYGDWLPCRLVPMDGSSRGRQVGPPHAGCTFAAWAPDGKWMYFTSKAGGLYHIWRQQFPDGQPQQYTSGPTEEEGIAMAPDGRSFVTAVALQSASIWIHDRNGERQISVLEGNAAYPKFTPDGRKLCYRVVKAVPRFGTNRDPGEVWIADLDTGRSQPIAPGLQPLDYDISPDGKQVVMEAADPDGIPRLFVAPIDRSSPPRQIPNVQGRTAHFGPSGEIFFRRTEASSAFVYRARSDGTGLHKALDYPVLAMTAISPDGRWIEAWSSLPGNKRAVVQAFPIDGGSPVLIGSDELLRWSPNQDYVWISGGVIAADRTYIVPLHRGKALPAIPAAGFLSEEDIASLPGAHRVDALGATGPSADVYAFEHHTVQRNLYRIPIQ